MTNRIPKCAQLNLHLVYYTDSRRVSPWTWTCRTYAHSCSPCATTTAWLCAKFCSSTHVVVAFVWKAMQDAAALGDLRVL